MSEGKEPNGFLGKVYDVFKNDARIKSFEEFESYFNALSDDEKRINFSNACLLYQKAVKCKACEPNISLLLLCSCANAIKVISKKRESRKNIVEFYLVYCPHKLRNELPISRASFEDTLDLIYKKFRNPFVHEAKELFEQAPNHTVKMAMIKYKNKFYPLYISNNSVLNWFEKVTYKSLCNYLTNTKVS
jgi:hypothetical protein